MIPLTSDVYLDNNATTRVFPQAAVAAHAAMEELYGNPSSSHITGLRARHLLESTRNLIRAYLGASSGRIIFTSGATEAIQMAIFSTLCRIREQGNEDPNSMSPPRALLYGATEHKAVPQALEHWNRLLNLGAAVVAIPVDAYGRLDLEFLADHAASADMVCTMAVNNETGVVHDLKAIERVLRDRNESAMWLVDSVQAVAKVPFNLATTTIDYAAVSGHKIHAPKGVGVLYARTGAPLTPLIAGGGQEDGARSGTENLPGVAALGVVFKALVEGDSRFRTSKQLGDFRDRLAASLERAFPSLLINTPFDESVPTTINFSVKGFTSKEMLDLFDAAGIRVSSGSACGSALVGSYVLEAMGMPPWRSEGAVRASIGLTTTDAEIDAACQRIEDAGRALRDSYLIASNDVRVRRGVALDGLIQLKKGSMCSWILNDAQSNQCVIVDPFEELAERIESLVRCQQCRVLAILDTHLHVDHRSCRQLLLDVLGDQVDPSGLASDELGWPKSATEEVVLADGSRARCFRLGERELVAQTQMPGHTVDGRVFLVGRPDGEFLLRDQIRFAFAGDAIQIGGLGRTDFASSDPLAMYHEIRRLATLIGDAVVICPTHDYVNGFSTTLMAERGQNELLSQVINSEITLEDFLTEKLRLDRRIVDRDGCELICGMIQSPSVTKLSIDLRPDELPAFFAEHSDWLVVDVREPQEFQFAQDWASLGLDEAPENIPLSRFTNFVQELLTDRDHHVDRDIVFICRSGNRSARAADVLRRSGFPRVWHIAGGIALGTPRPDQQVIEADDMEFVI